MEIKFDYSKLRGRIKEILGTESKLSDEIGLSKVSLSHKLNNKVGFTPTEMVKILDILDLPIDQVQEIFFTKQIKKT